MGQMAKAVRGRRRKTVARKVTAPAKRKQATTGMTSDKFRALVNNLSAQELDELLKVATKRKNDEIASVRASFLDEVKSKQERRSSECPLPISSAWEAATRTGRLQPLGRAPAAAKYRNPKTGETWSGRGRPAKWVTDLEAEGRTRQEFAV
jgi:DNA-binding protein H-NS